MARPVDMKEAPSLLVTVLRQITRLMQDELALARAELKRSLSRAGSGLAMICIGAILALTALDVLAGAAVGYLAANGFSVGTAALIVGGIVLVFAVVFALVGKSRLSAEALAPDTTTRNLRRDLDAVKEATDGQ